jgi:intracellular protein transport protein USO1
VQALRLLPTNISFPFSEISVTPYVPVPETNGEEWDRLESASALDVLVELTVHGEYNGLGDGSRTKRSLELRTVAAAVFEVTKKNLVHKSYLIDSNTIQNFVRKEEIRQAIVETMLPHGTSGII